MKKLFLLSIFLIIPILCPAPEFSSIPILVSNSINIGDIVLDAIIDYESRGNPNALNSKEDAVGILQITPIAIKEVNRILSIRGIKKSYSLSDRWDPIKSKEIYYITQAFHNPSYNPQLAARLWNGDRKSVV